MAFYLFVCFNQVLLRFQHLIGLVHRIAHLNYNFRFKIILFLPVSSKASLRDGSFYTWTLLLTICLVLVGLFIFWNRHRVKHFPTSLKSFVIHREQPKHELIFTLINTTTSQHCLLRSKTVLLLKFLIDLIVSFNSCSIIFFCAEVKR